MAATNVRLTGCTEFEAAAAGEQTKLLVMASLAAPEMPQSGGQERTPISISAVIDRSGSMQGSKLTLTKRTLRFVISNLRASDQFGLISYACSVTEDLPLMRMDAAGRQKAVEAVESLEAEGGTNLSDGLFAGIDQLRGTTPESGIVSTDLPSGRCKNEVTSVWLFTDGCANAGITDPAELARLTADRLQGATTQCSVFAYGFGQDHNASFLRDVADAGHGLYYHIEGTDSIAEAFADCLGGLMTVVARTLRLTVTPTAGVTLCRLFTNFDSQLQATHAWVSLPDLYAEERRDLLLEVAVGPAEPSDEPAPIVRWSLAYRNLLTDEDETASTCCYLARPKEAPPAAPHLLLDEQRNRVRCVDGLESAQRVADLGDLAGARHGLQELRAAIEDSQSAASPLCQGLLKDIADCADHLRSREDYASVGHMYMCHRSMAHGQQRSCGPNTALYETSAKREMVRLSKEARLARDQVLGLANPQPPQPRLLGSCQIQ